MKSLRQLCVALALTLALAIPAFAGEIDTPKASPAPPAPVTTVDGEIHTTVTGQIETTISEATVTDSVAETVLNLLQSVLSLF